jgi:hypothetical protein
MINPLQTRKVKGLENNDLKVVQAPMRLVPDDFFVKKPFLGSIIGQRGSGKTNSLIQMIFHCDKYKMFDKIYLFSPTAFGNDPKYDLLETTPHSYELQKFSTYTDVIFKDVVEEIKRDIDDFKEWEKKMKLYNKFIKYGYTKLTPQELRDIDLMMNASEEIEEPECRFEKMPTSLLVFDDLVSNTELYKNTPRGIFYNFAILHRHLLSSLLFVCQTWTSAVPKQIRANLSFLMVFNLKPEIKKAVADEMCSSMKEDDFIHMWDSACVNSYDFFLINFDEKDKKKRYRKNFNELFLI